MAAPLAQTRSFSGSTLNVIAGLLDRTGIWRRRFHKRSALRILCYHGVCRDEEASDPDTPSYFVTASQFEAHLDTLRRLGPIVHLPEWIACCEAGEALDAPGIAITFDDVAACTFACARPVLAAHGVRASFFVSTGHVDSGRLFDFDVLSLLRRRRELVSNERLKQLIDDPARHKRLALSRFRPLLDAPERRLRDTLDTQVVERLRPLNASEVRTLDREGHEIGGHTVDHAILGPLDRDDRTAQIQRSFHRLAEILGRTPIGFAYPNGGPGDFDVEDCRCVEHCGYRYAVSTEPGFGTRTVDRFALPRIGVGMGHTPAKLALEASGLLDDRRRRQQGW